MTKGIRGLFRFFRFLVPVLLVFGPACLLFAQVDRQELQQNQQGVDFTNYEGPYDRIETRAQIRDIGFQAGTAIRGGALRTGTDNRYFVIHSVSDADGEKLDADIFGLGPGTSVDHIRNLRLIVQGYLEAAYGYSAEDASLLAEYITIYNAVFRGNAGYFNDRYKTAVTGYLEPGKEGLSTRYDQWPGQTLMLIPLGTGAPGSLSAIDTSSLTAPEVVDELRQEGDMGIPQRQDMIDLKEREADAAEQTAANQRAAADQEAQNIAAERSGVAAERDAIAQDRQAAADAQAAGTVSAEEAQKTEADLAQREAAADQKEEELNQRDDAVAEQREAASQNEAFAAQKTEEAQQERQDVARDQQTVIAQEDAQAKTTDAPGILAAKITAASAALGSLVRLDPSTASELLVSALNTVNVRTITQISGKILAVAGQNVGNGAIRLVEIAPDTLQMVKQGEDDIHSGSLIWTQGNDLYAIVSSNSKLYMARFDATLARQAQSTTAVHPYAGVLFQDSTIVTQGEDGRPLILKASDLSAAN